MTEKLDSYETALLTELRTYVAEREVAPAPRRSRRRLALAGVAAAAAAGIAVVALPGAGPAPAYAFSEASDGTVHVEVGTDATPEELEAAFADHGITADVTYLDLGMMCDGSRGTPGTMPSGTWSFGIGVSHDGFALDIPETTRPPETRWCSPSPVPPPSRRTRTRPWPRRPPPAWAS